MRGGCPWRLRSPDRPRAMSRPPKATDDRFQKCRSSGPPVSYADAQGLGLDSFFLRFRSLLPHGAFESELLHLNQRIHVSSMRFSRGFRSSQKRHGILSTMSREKGSYQLAACLSRNAAHAQETPTRVQKKSIHVPVPLNMRYISDIGLSRFSESLQSLKCAFDSQASTWANRAHIPRSNS